MTTSASICKRLCAHDGLFVSSTRAFSSGSGGKKPDTPLTRPPPTKTVKKSSTHPLDMAHPLPPSRASVKPKEPSLSTLPLAFQKNSSASASEGRPESMPPSPPGSGPYSSERPLRNTPAQDVTSNKRSGPFKWEGSKSMPPHESHPEPSLPYFGHLKRSASDTSARETRPPVFSGNRYLQPPSPSPPSPLSSSSMSRNEDPSFVYNFGPMKQNASLSESFFGGWSAADSQSSFLSANDQRLSKYERESLDRKRLESRDDVIHLMPGQSYDGVLTRALRPKSHAFSKEVERAMNRYDFTVLEELFDLPAIASSVAGSLSRQTITKLREFQMPVLPQQIEESLSREFFTFIRATDWQAYRPFQPSFPEANRLIQEHLFYEMGKRKLAFQAATMKAWAVKMKTMAKASPLPPPSAGASTSAAHKKGKGAHGSSEPVVPLKPVEKKSKIGLRDTPMDVQARRMDLFRETDTMMKEIATGDYARHGQPVRLLLASTGSSTELTRIQSEHPNAYQVLLSAAKALGMNPSLHPSMKADSLKIIQDILLTRALPVTRPDS